MTTGADQGMPDRSRARARDAVLFLVVSGAYISAAKLGLSLDVSHGVITPVWAPSGIALAALLILGARFWPAVAVGAFVANGGPGPHACERELRNRRRPSRSKRFLTRQHEEPHAGLP